MKKIVLTGGGTAGHVTPNIALIEYLQARDGNIRLAYIGSHTGIERKLVTSQGVFYHAITTGKWQRAFRISNLLTPYRLVRGMVESLYFCWWWKPVAVVSKGGFVALPVVIAAWLLRIPIVVHESDVVPGLANRISFPFATRICHAFTLNVPKRYRKKTRQTGLAVREQLLRGAKSEGLMMLRFASTKPVLLIWGGSLGAATLNRSVSRLLPQLLLSFQVVHLLGSGTNAVERSRIDSYRAFTYLDTKPLAHVLAAADLVVSRAGATALYELLLLRKPHILCPLSTQNSRGEQIKNARYSEKIGLSKVIYPAQYTDTALLHTITDTFRQLPRWQQALNKHAVQSGASALYDELLAIK